MRVIGGPHAVYCHCTAMTFYRAVPTSWASDRFVGTHASDGHHDLRVVRRVRLRSGLTQCSSQGARTRRESPPVLAQHRRLRTPGGNLIVVDTRLSMTAVRASIWLHPLPGTDTVFAYAGARDHRRRPLRPRVRREEVLRLRRVLHSRIERTLEEASELTKVSCRRYPGSSAHLRDQLPRRSALGPRRRPDRAEHGPAAPCSPCCASRETLDVPGGYPLLNERPTFLSEMELEGSARLSRESREHTHRA